MTIHLKPMNGDCAAVLSKQTNNGRRLLSCFVTWGGRAKGLRGVARRSTGAWASWAECVECGLRVGVAHGVWVKAKNKVENS